MNCENCSWLGCPGAAAGVGPALPVVDPEGAAGVPGEPGGYKHDLCYFRRLDGRPAAAGLGTRFGGREGSPMDW